MNLKQEKIIPPEGAESENNKGDFINDGPVGYSADEEEPLTI